jgi:hypothetical protein
MSLSPTLKERSCDRCMKRRPRDARGRFLPTEHSCLLSRIVRADFYAALAGSATYPRRFFR